MKDQIKPFLNKKKYSVEILVTLLVFRLKLEKKQKEKKFRISGNSWISIAICTLASVDFDTVEDLRREEKKYSENLWFYFCVCKHNITTVSPYWKILSKFGLKQKTKQKIKCKHSISWLKINQLMEIVPFHQRWTHEYGARLGLKMDTLKYQTLNQIVYN